MTAVIRQDDQAPVWWVICVAGDALNAVVGPLQTEDDAKAESATAECHRGHFITTRMPGEDQRLDPPLTYCDEPPFGRSARLLWCLDWQRHHCRTPRLQKLRRDIQEFRRQYASNHEATEAGGVR